MADPDSALLGGHALPERFSSAPVARRRARRPRPGLIIGASGVLLAGAVFGGLQLAANLGFDDAAEQFAAQERTTRSALADVGESTSALDAMAAVATQILDGDDGSLVEATTKDALAEAVAAADAAVAEASGVLDTPLPDAGDKPDWFWELFAASDRLTADSGDLADLHDDLSSESPLIDAAGSTVSDAGIALLSSAAAAAPAFEAAHVSAKNDAIISLRDTAADLSDTTTLDQEAVDAFLALQDAAAQVVATEQVELAEKAGPLMSTRLEIEAFARSLAPGVLLEFDWSPIVSGAGEGGSMGGLTTWWWSSPGHAVIELSNSVAQQWPSISSKSLVAHEVGHAISVKCQGMYDASTQDSIEKWATAWAISMGYTDDANGVWAYGYPPQSYIDAAAGCR